MSDIALGIAIAITFVGVICYYLGVFHPMNIVKKKLPPSIVLGRFIKGPYHQIKIAFQQFAKDCKTNEDILGELKDETNHAFGIYYDDPNTTKPENCRSFIGTRLNQKFLNDNTMLDDVIKKDELNMHIMKFPETDCWGWDFPIRNSISFMIGAMRFYPAYNTLVAAKSDEYKFQSGCIKITNFQSNSNVYLVPQSNFESFRHPDSGKDN